MMGNKPSLSPHIFDRDENVGIAYGMGLTAERVAERWKISREAQDAFSVESHRRALEAQRTGEFNDEIAAFTLNERFPDLATGEIRVNAREIKNDEGPRAGHDPGRAREVASGVRGEGFGHGRQQLADVGRRGRVDRGQREDPQAIQPDAARAFREFRGAWRAAGDHGHRSEGSDSCRVESGGH